MKADTVEVLMTKGQFPAEQALAVAEAIDMVIRDAQLVTVPVLDARFLTFESKMDGRFAKVDARFVALETRMDARFSVSEAKMDARFAASEAKMDARFSLHEAKADAKSSSFEARMDQKFERLRLHLIIAILIGSAAMGPLGNAVLEALKRAF